MNINHMQLSITDLALIEAEVTVTNASMKLHEASKESLRAKNALDEIAGSLSRCVRQTGLTESALVDYFIHRAVLTTQLGSAKLRLMEAEEAEASAEYEWEIATETLAQLKS